MMMMATGDGSATVEGTVTGLGTQIQNMGTNLTKAFESSSTAAGTIVSRVKDGIDAASKFEQTLISNARSLGQSADYAKRLENELAQAGIRTVLMGGKLEDALNVMEKMSVAMERTSYFSINFLSNVQAVKQFGVGEATIEGFVKFFDKVGGGMDQAMDRTIQLVNTAQKYGLNAGKFVGDVAAKMDMLNKYGFPKGVDDLASMVVKSKQLGDTLSVAQNMADQIMDSPEKAYEMAAQLQTLGGSFSQLGDGAQLLYMAQNDLQGLQDQIVKATRGIATFNKETGQFQISTQERLRLKQLKNLGMDVDKIEETALRLAKSEKIMNEMTFNPKIFAGLSEEEKSVLANYAQIGAGGTITIEGKDLQSYNKDDIGKLVEQLTNSAKDAQGNLVNRLSADADKNVSVVEKNLSANEQLTLTQNKLTNAYAMGILSVQNFSVELNKVANVGTKINNSIAAEISKLTAGGGQKVKDDIEKATNILNTTVATAQQGLNIPAGGTGSFVNQNMNIRGTVALSVQGIDAKLAELIKNNLTEYINREVTRQMRPHPHEGGPR